jgi:PAS domain S-box-containing protein
MGIQDNYQAGLGMNIPPADWRVIFDAVSDAILIHDGATGEILDVNRGMCEMFGYTPEEARELPVTALGGSDSGWSPESVRSLMVKAASGSPQVFEWQVRDRAGRVFWVEAHLKPVRVDGCDRILAVLRDIDQRKQAEEALKESEARYRMVTEGSLAGVYVIQDGGFAYLNPTMAQIFGYQPEEIMSRRVEPKDLIHPDDLALVRDKIARRLSGELEVAHYTFRGVHRDGSVIYCESYGRAVEYQGRPAVVGTLLDITERWRAEEAVITQTRILESMAEGVTVTDAEGTIIYTNPAFDTMFGYQGGELLGQKVSVLNDLTDSEVREFVQELVDQLQSKRLLSGEVRNRKKDGTTFFSRARISALEISGKTCWIMVQEDITERKQIEDALRQSEASYRVVTESSLAGVYLIQDGLFRYVNPMLAQAFGYSVDELIDRLGPLDLVHPEDRARIAETMQRRLAGEKIGTRNIFKGLRQDGSVIYGEVLTRQVEYRGRPAIMGTLLDITERRLAEEALKASEEKYRTIFGAVNDAIVVVDPETGKFLEVNQKFLELRGCDVEEAKQHSLANVCSADPPFTLQDAWKVTRKAVEEGPQLFEWWVEEEHGGQRWIEINLTLTPLDGQNRLLAVCRDIGERKQAEDVRRRAYEELEGLVAERTAGLQSANTQLHREIEERRRTESIIRLQRDLALTLSGKLGLQETLRLCVETGIIISGLDSGGVYLVNPASGGLDLAYHQGLSHEFVQQGRHYEADDLNTYLIMAGKPLYARLEELPGMMDESGLKEGLRSVAVIPVIHQDRVIASLNIASHQYEEVPATARAALETLAAQVGSAIARAQAEEALRRAKEELEIRVADRTAQLKQANERLEEELRVRARIEQSLRQSEAKYRTLVEQLPAVTYITTLTEGGGLFYVSPQIETLLGFSPEEWRAEDMETWKRQIHPEDRERVLAEITKSIAKGGPFVAEYRILAKSGRVVWFRDEARVIHDQEGGFFFLQGLALDITARKQAEEALRETTHTLQTLIQASPLAIIALDRDLKIRLWNPGAERMFGWLESEVQGRPLPFVPEDRLPDVRAMLAGEMKGEARSALELRRLRKDGTSIDVQLWTASLTDARGEHVGIMGIFADITESKRAAEALQEANSRLQTLVQASPLAIIALNLEGRIISWNPAAESMFGWREEEIIGQVLPTIADGREQEFQALRQQALEGTALLDLEQRRQRRDGSRVDVSLSAAPLHDGTGATIGTMGIIQDITARKRAEEALKKSERELRLLTARLLSIQEQERRRVARELHDELGQALTVLKINLVAIEDRLSARQRHLKANCEQMLAYIDTVIENVRRLSWDLSPSSLEDLGLSAALGYLVDETCRNHQMQSAVVMDEIDPLFSPDTQINIYRIFQESLTNVVKHARASLVSVKVKRDNGKVSFMIGDNGRGFDLKRAMSRKVPRRSLGLTAMNERALMADGSLQITSRKGRGTTIIFTIPIGKPGK